MAGHTGTGFRPVNELERVLARWAATGSRATLLRALARSTVYVLTDPAAVVLTGRVSGLSDVVAGQRAWAGPAGVHPGPLRVPCVVDQEGCHALVYTSYRQLSDAHQVVSGRTLPCHEVPVATLFEHWPVDVDVWLNAGSPAECLLGEDDIRAVAEIAAGRQVEEAYQVGPADTFTDFPGPPLPDPVDCAVAVALLDTPEVLEVFRMFRRLDEPEGRTWRILLVLTDGGHTGNLARAVVRAVNAASDECCEVHVADVHDDDVYDVVAPMVQVGIPLWRRDGFCVPDTPEGIERLDVGPDEPTSF